MSPVSYRLLRLDELNTLEVPGQVREHYPSTCSLWRNTALVRSTGGLSPLRGARGQHLRPGTGDTTIARFAKMAQTQTF